jgi:hypothetical protein
LVALTAQAHLLRLHINMNVLRNQLLMREVFGAGVCHPKGTQQIEAIL